MELDTTSIEKRNEAFETLLERCIIHTKIPNRSGKMRPIARFVVCRAMCHPGTETSKISSADESSSERMLSCIHEVEEFLPVVMDITLGAPVILWSMRIGRDVAIGSTVDS